MQGFAIAYLAKAVKSDAVDGATQGVPAMVLFPLLEGITVFGRGEDCGFRIRDEAISRKQFQLRVEVGAMYKIFITDLKSKNGTHINRSNDKIPANVELQLQVGDVITVNQYTYIVQAVQ